MPVSNQTPPAGALRALDVVPNLIHPNDRPLSGAIADIQNRPLDHNPHPIQTLNLSDIVNSSDLARARHIGWRFVVSTSDGRQISTGVQSDPSNTDHSFGQLNQGPFVAATEQVLNSLQNDPLIQQGNYTFSVLRIPALYVMALWLHDQDGKEDRIVPIPPVPPALTAGTLYTVGAFLDALRDPARQRLSNSAQDQN